MNRNAIGLPPRQPRTKRTSPHSPLRLLQYPSSMEKGKSTAQQQVLNEGPVDIVLIRHGVSEANAARKLNENGKMSAAALKDFLQEIPDHRVRLAPEGRTQGTWAGNWLKECGLVFDPRGFYVSDYVRAMETALIVSEGAGVDITWKQDARVGERSWGSFHELDTVEQDRQYTKREQNPRHWLPNLGESLRTVSLHVGSFIDRLYREHSGSNVVIVTHGEFITAFRAAMERLTESAMSESIITGVPNCGVVHYSRRNPETGELSDRFDWVRFSTQSENPKYKKLWTGEWRQIVRPRLNSEALRKMIDEVPTRLTPSKN